MPGPRVEGPVQVQRLIKHLYNGGEGSVFRNIYKGHMDKTKWGQDQGWRVRMAGVEGIGSGGMETTVLE